MFSLSKIRVRTTLDTFRFEALSFPAILFTISILLMACGAPDGSREDGQRWFAMHNCSKCHGLNANDGPAPKIASIDRSFGSFVAILRKPNSVSMPSFPEEIISRQDAADIYTWLKSLPE